MAKFNPWDPQNWSKEGVQQSTERGDRVVDPWNPQNWSREGLADTLSGGGSGTGVDLAGNMDPADYQLHQLMNYAENQKRENQGFLNDYLRPKVDEYGRAADRANYRDALLETTQQRIGDQTIGGIDDIVGEAENLYGGYAGQMSGLIDQNQTGLENYLGKNADIATGVGNYGWEDAQSSQEGLDAQRSALSKYESLTNPAVTGQEKYMMEVARRQQEQGELASRDAVMSDLGARGMRGSGMELTNMLGRQEQLGQERTLANLGMQANAVDRSMQALQGYGQTANAMRQYGDIINMFNAKQSDSAKQWQLQKQQDLAKEAADQTRSTTEANSKMEGEKYGAGADMLSGKYKANQDKYGIGRDFIRLSSDNNERGFNRTGRATGAAADYAGMYTGSGRADSAPIYAGYQQLAGNAAAGEAYKEAEKNTPFLDLPFINLRAGGRTIL